MSTHKTENNAFQDPEGYRLVGELVRDSKYLMNTTGADDGDAATDETADDEQLQDEFEVEAEEAAPLAVAPSPTMPSPAEVEEHRITHIPFRSWCRECTMGRGLGERRGRHLGREHKIPVVGVDYFYISNGDLKTRQELDFADGAEGDEKIATERQEGKLVKCLVLRCHQSKNVFGYVIPCKGVDEDLFAVKLVVQAVAWMGHIRVIVKSDNEASLLSMVNRALTSIKCDVQGMEAATAEQSQAYDSQSNGGTEVGVKILRGHFRTLKLCLEARIGKSIPINHPVVPWLLEHAALLHGVCARGEDGLTAWARVRGRNFGQRLVGFGEKVYWKPPLRGPQHDLHGNMGPRLMEGIFLGYKRESNSYRVYTANGEVVESRALQRKPLQDRWSAEGIEAIASTPWSLRTREAAKRVPLGEDVEKHKVLEDDKVPIPRRLKITKYLLEQYGTTADCPQCEHIQAFGEHKGGLQHSEKCRARIVKAMQETVEGNARLQRTDERINRGIAKRIETQDARQADKPQDAKGTDEPQFTDLPRESPEAHPSEDAEMSNDWPEWKVKYLRESLERSEPDGSDQQAQPTDHDTVTEDKNAGMDVDIVGVNMLRYEDEIMNVLNVLGAPPRSHRREHKAAVNRLVSEIYSPPRVTKLISMMPEMGLVSGFALDVTCNDPDDDQPWDFDVEAKRQKAEQKVRDEKPMVLIGSPMCTAFCRWQALNNLKRDGHVVEEELRRAKMHLDFVVHLYRIQIEGGRLFLHEHPASATSWRHDTVEQIMQLPGVHRIIGDQCQYGAQARRGARAGDPVRKPSGFMSNGPLILKELGKRCSGKNGWCSRRKGGQHVTASGQVAKDAAIYPDGLCRAIIKGIAAELEERGIINPGEVGMHAVTDDANGNEVKNASTGYSGKYKDDITGQLLKDSLVIAARRTELTYFNAKGVWTKVPRQQAFARTGKPPVSVRWVDVNKGDDMNPKYRSRLVARQMKAQDTSGASFFAPTPPLESLKIVISLAATSIGSWRVCRDPNSEQRTQISLMDISRAYFNAKVDEDVPTFVQLPPEDPDAGVLCGKLLRHMYGTRAAADGWQEEYSSTLVSALGFVQGISSPCIFRHRERDIVVTVHGDDFTSVGSKVDLDWLEAAMQDHYELTIQPRMGPGAGDAKEGLILNRVVRYTDDGIEYEADPRQAEKLSIECGVQGSNTVATPGVRQSFAETVDDKPLDAKMASPFRGAAARANYLAADRLDVQFAAKEVCRWMSAPTDQAWSALKRLSRYLEGLPRLVYVFRWQEAKAIDIYTDTDWAGCPRTRKSTSGGCVMLGHHTVKTWSSTQASVALSSGEAEFNGVVRGSGIGLGCQSLLKDLGIDLPVRIWTDSSAAIGICTRQGLGKVRHLDTHTLWVQQAVRSGRIDLRKVLGEVNPADLFTKHSISRDRLMKLVNIFDCKFMGGRASAAPLTRTQASDKVKVADVCGMTVDPDPIMPHTVYTLEEMNELYPSVEVPEDPVGEDFVDPEEDHLLQEGKKTVVEFLRALEEQGRRRRLEVVRGGPQPKPG